MARGPVASTAGYRAAERDRTAYGWRLLVRALPPWLYAFALVLWAASWNLRLSVLMAWLPFEPIQVGSVAVALCVVHRCGRPLRLDPRVAGPLALVVVSFLPGILHSGGEGYGPEKVRALALVLLPAVLAATILLDSREARVAWVWLQALVGVAVVAAVQVRSAIDAETGRLTLGTVDPIAAARLVGVATVVLLLGSLQSWGRALWALPLALLCGASLVQMGSRGPALFAFVTLVVCVLVWRCFAGRRLLLLGVALLVGVLVYEYALGSGSGGRRIADWVQGGLPDDARTLMFHDAVGLGMRHLFGIGWGGFAEASPTAGSIANAQGNAYAHDVFAEAFSEGGVLALLGMLVVIAVALVRLQRLSADPAEALVLAVAVFWLLNATVSYDIPGNRFLWVTLAGALTALPALPRPPGRVGAAPGEARERMLR